MERMVSVMNAKRACESHATLHRAPRSNDAAGFEPLVQYYLYMRVSTNCFTISRHD